MKKIQKIVILLLALCLVLAGIFFAYVSDDYRAGESAQAILASATLRREENCLVLDAEGSSTGLIFYPGAKVEYTAYLPLMEALYQEGISCYLVEMPFNLAFFGSNRGQKIMEAHPEISTWYLAGHSLGGAFAASFAGKHQEKVDALILLGAYPYGQYPLAHTLMIYGSEDCVLNREKLGNQGEQMEIEGGNHAYFADYGEQAGDGSAQISREQQIQQTTEGVMAFLANRR